MKVLIAESAGFCHGVSRAVSLCEKAALTSTDCVMLGPIIHNEHVIRMLGEKGVGIVSDTSEVSRGQTVVIRSHGAGKKEYDALADLGAEVVDATCLDVKKIHKIVCEQSHSGRLPVIIGKRSHPEVVAIAGWCDFCEVFETVEELSEWLENDDNAHKPISVVFQTTNTEKLYALCCELIKKECTNQKIFDTICKAACKRRQEAAELSKKADVMVVVGGNNSANSLRLADICKEHCARVVFAEKADDLSGADISESDVVGITAGASTPAWIIKEVTQKMSQEVKLDETQENSEFGINDSELVTAEPETEKETEAPPETESSENAAEPEPADTEEQPAEPEAEADEEQAATDEPVADEAGVLPEADATDEETADDKASDTSDAEPEDQVMDEPQDGVSEKPVEAEEPAGSVEPAEADEETEQEESQGAAETFEEMLEKSIKTLHTGEKVTGIVTSITATEVSVDLGTKQSGYIPIGEFTDDANSQIDDIIKIGDTIEAFVMRVNDVEGMVMLSKKRLDAIKNWDVIEAAKESRAIVEGVVTEENKGGVVVNIKGVRVFVPASQTGLPKSSPMSELVKKTVKLRVTEVNQSRRRVVGSIRAVQADERRERSDKLWQEIEAGKQYGGVVKSMTSYGVFVDIGGVDGMIHISELSWTRIKQPSEVMSVGDEVSVFVLSFDKENRKISLGYKKNEDNPWSRFTTNNSVGDVVTVKIVKMMPFGAFAEIIPGVDGLIHISQITDHRIGLPSEVLANGQSVEVKITEIDNDRKKVSLSIRALMDPSSQPVTESEAARAVAADNTPVVVYDTDAPPEEEAEPEAELLAEEPETTDEPDVAAEPEAAEDPDIAEEPGEA